MASMARRRWCLDEHARRRGGLARSGNVRGKAGAAEELSRRELYMHTELRTRRDENRECCALRLTVHSPKMDILGHFPYSFKQDLLPGFAYTDNH